MLTLRQLREYSHWAGKSAHQVHRAVFARQGWGQVFRGALPEWASRVRNYFNITPHVLLRVGNREAAGILARFDHMNVLADGWSGLLTSKALTDFVYTDPARTRPWLLVEPGGSIYHTGDGKFGVGKFLRAYFGGQAQTAFKLVAPDENGGSHEVIVQNPGKLEDFGLPLGIPFPVFADFNEIRRGSYNYGETAVRGYGDHKRLDIEPHKAERGFYVNPTNPYASLGARIFPARLPRRRVHPPKTQRTPPDPNRIPFSGRRAPGGQYY